MGLLSHRVERREISAGDHIYTWRAIFTYSHHGIYVGGSKVVHFTSEQNFGSTGESSLGSLGSYLNISTSSQKIPSICPNFPDCGFQQPKSGVVLSCLDCFLGSGSLYRFEYGVAPSIFLAKVRGGTCTTAQSDPPDVVIHRAVFLLQNGFRNYDVFKNNCEDFALYCKTGLLITDIAGPGGSGQAACVLGVPVAVLLSSPLRMFMSNCIVAMATAGVYCMSRYATDIGVRDDVVKVKVEDLPLFNGCNEELVKEDGCCEEDKKEEEEEVDLDEMKKKKKKIKKKKKKKMHTICEMGG